MKLNNINLFLAIVWLAVCVLSFIPKESCAWVVRCVTFFFGVVYFKGWVDGKKE